MAKFRTSINLANSVGKFRTPTKFGTPTNLETEDPGHQIQDTHKLGNRRFRIRTDLNAFFGHLPRNDSAIDGCPELLPPRNDSAIDGCPELLLF
jgi:hypothetical protein